MKVFPDNKREQYLEKPLPSSHESERAILGSILIDNTLVAEAAEVLRPEDFYSPMNRRVYAAMLALFDQKQAIDPILIGEELKREGSLESIGGVAAITNLSFGIPHFDSIGDYIEIVRQKSQLRDLIRTCSSITSEALAEDTATGKILTTAQTAINQVCTRDVKSDFVTVQEQGFEIYNKTVALRNREITSTGLQTGLRSLDFLTDGFQPADLIIIGGRPSMGKSNFGGTANGVYIADLATAFSNTSSTDFANTESAGSKIHPNIDGQRGYAEVIRPVYTTTRFFKEHCAFSSSLVEQSVATA
jgi:replicative DNA helicase